MSPELIQSKLQPPSPVRNPLARSHLTQRLEAGRACRLTLISAPAGYGKSTLVNLWLASTEDSVAWLSLDANDNDVGVFLRYLTAAVHRVAPDACQSIAALLDGPQLPPQTYLLQAIAGEVASLSAPFTIVLDDYHVIQNEAIHELIATCLQYQSPYLHLIIATRQDPPFSMTRLRASEQLTEFRLADLRFTAAEINQYLDGLVDETLSTDLFDAVSQRTEGWPVGLRLVSLALRGQSNPAEFVRSIRGTNRYITEYLVDEVLDHQSPAIQRFLMFTSILKRLCVDLCDALLTEELASSQTETPSNAAILAELRNANLFLIALDTQDQWFRYHHLFQDLLRHRLQAAFNADEINTLHGKAISWFTEHEFYEEALEHALTTNDIAKAIDLFTQQRSRLMNETRWQQLEQLLNRFPKVTVESEPSLYVAQVWLLYYQGRWGELAQGIEHLSNLLAGNDLPSPVSALIQGEMSTQIALVAFISGDWDNAIACSSLALQQIPQAFWMVRVLAQGILALGLQGKGQLDQAYQSLHESFNAESADNELLPSPLLVLLCYVHWIAADLNAVIREAQQSMAISERLGAQAMLGGSRHHLASALYQQNRLSEAAAQFEQITAQPYLHYREFYVYGAIGLAQTYQAQQRPDEAQAIADQVLAFLLQTGNTTLLPVVEALQAELALQQGHFAAAVQWAKRQPERPPVLPMFRPYEPNFTLIKVWLQQNTQTSRRHATNLITQLIDYLRSTHNPRSLIDALTLQSLQLAQSGDQALALKSLEEAVKLAQPGKVIRAFVDLGAEMAALLAQLKPSSQRTQRFVQQILAAYPLTERSPDVGNGNRANGHLTEPLTQREVEVLTRLMQYRTDQEIAQELYISLNTVRSHTKHIYAKLNVHNRRQAVQKAKELGLITPSP